MKVRSLMIWPLFLLCLSGCAGLNNILSSDPLKFSCARYDPFVKIDESYLFAELRKFARDPDARESSVSPLAQRMQDIPRTLESPFQLRLARRASYSRVENPRPLNILLLSGGGQWGAFGAGYLSELNQSGHASEWDIVTGISTGAMQALFVGAEDYVGLREAYTIEDQSRYAAKNGVWGLLRKGSQYDTSALRDEVLDQLLGTNGGRGLLARIASNEGPSVRVGVVRAKTGDFFKVDLTNLIRSNYDHKSAENRNKLADCVAGIVMASSGVPVQLTPVQIDGITYSDGGVRESVFAADLALDAELVFSLSSIYAERAVLLERERIVPALGADSRETESGAVNEGAHVVPPPRFFVVRNGPTILPDDDPSGLVDQNPTVWRTGMRAYATLVNQNELNSITSVLLEYPRRPLQFVSADGYDWIDYANGNPTLDCEDLKRPTDQYFSPPFMRCLMEWGTQTRTHPDGPKGWREIANRNVCPQDEDSEGQSQSTVFDGFGAVCSREIFNTIREAERQVGQEILRSFRSYDRR